MKTTSEKNTTRDIYQQVTDLIIQQLEAGTVPWHQPWVGSSNIALTLPQNASSGNRYRGINIVLLWASAIKQNFDCDEWATFKQWQEKKETVRKGEKGSMIVYYDSFEKEIDGEIQNVPFLKSSCVFNRCQLASYEPAVKPITEKSSIEVIQIVDDFVKSTGAIIEYRDNKACYIPCLDIINLPPPEDFIETETCTATEGYYATLCHELIHWSGSKERLNRTFGKRFGDKTYAIEELVAELGGAFLCAGFGVPVADKGHHTSYIAHWLEVLKENKYYLITAASAASKAVDFLQTVSPKSAIGDPSTA